MARNWTAEQSAIFDAIANSSENIAVGAVAGSGKTTTTVQGTECAGSNVGFTSFGKHIADELRARLGKGAESGTMHSFGYRIIRARFNSQMDEHKLRKHALAVRPNWFFTGKLQGQILAAEYYPALELVSAAKAACKFNATPGQMSELAIDRDIDLPRDRVKSAEITSGAAAILRSSINDTRTCDYDDMIALPVAHNLLAGAPIYDTLFVDECQDLNPCQQALSMAMGVRKIVVGDPRQAIMGFSGADTNSYPNLVEMLNARELPLSFCWRCPANHIELAKMLVPAIQAAPNAIVGGLGDRTSGEMIKAAKPGDMIICRTNAPLVSLAYGFIAAGKPAMVKGRSIGEGLINMLRRMRPKTLAELSVKLEKWRADQYEALAEKDRATPENLARVDDRVNCINTLAEICQSVDQLRDRLNSLFADKGLEGKIVLSSIHRSKGLEADTVWFYEPGLCPMSGDLQEKNLLYVALTRSKRDLWFVDGSVRRHVVGADWVRAIAGGAINRDLATIPSRGDGHQRVEVEPAPAPAKRARKPRKTKGE